MYPFVMRDDVSQARLSVPLSVSVLGMLHDVEQDVLQDWESESVKLDEQGNVQS